MKNYKKAEKLTTQKEFRLIERSEEELSLSALKLLLSRARKLRNKYVDLSRRQAIKNKPGAGIPDRTEEKSKLFEGVVKKIQMKLKTKQKTHSKSKKKAAKPRLGTKNLKSGAKRSDSSRAEALLGRSFTQAKDFSKKTRAKRKANRIERTSSKRIMGSVSSLNKRNQKQRDLKNA